jgi:NAD(P)-dependent dehydrogenase (short-subunit alcohol dehydrogenase family)
MANLTNKTAMITGGSRGIGAAIAKRLAVDGANVAITYTKGADAAAQVVKAIQAAGGKAIAIQADATDVNAVDAAIEKTVKTFGGLDILVNNAGTAIPKPFEEATLEEMDQMLNLNVRGVFVATQAALKTPEERWSCYQHWLLCRRAGDDARSGGLLRHQGRGEAVHAGPVSRGRHPRHHGQQRPARPHRHRPEPRRGRPGEATDREHSVETIRHGRRNRRDGGLRCWSRSELHHGRQPDR